MRKHRFLIPLAAVLLAVGSVALTAPVASAGGTPMPAAAPRALPSNCHEADGPVVSPALSKGSWTQQLILEWCSEANHTFNLRAHVLLKPQLQNGYQPSHVVNCTAHVSLQHGAGTPNDQAVNGSCTDAAQKPVGGNSIPDYIWTGVGPGSYTVRGYVNIQTGVVIPGSDLPSTRNLTFT